MLWRLSEAADLEMVQMCVEERCLVQWKEDAEDGTAQEGGRGDDQRDS